MAVMVTTVRFGFPKMVPPVTPFESSADALSVEVAACPVTVLARAKSTLLADGPLYAMVDLVQADLAQADVLCVPKTLLESSAVVVEEDSSELSM